jgi:hypothetical protein
VHIEFVDRVNVEKHTGLAILEVGFDSLICGHKDITVQRIIGFQESMRANLKVKANA